MSNQGSIAIPISYVGDITLPNSLMISRCYKVQCHCNVRFNPGISLALLPFELSEREGRGQEKKASLGVDVAPTMLNLTLRRRVARERSQQPSEKNRHVP